MIYIPHLSSRKCDRTRPKRTILCGAKNTVVLGSIYLLQLRDIDRRSNMFSFTKPKALFMPLFSVFFVKIECEGYKDSFGNIRNIFQVSRNSSTCFEYSLHCVVINDSFVTFYSFFQK